MQRTGPNTTRDEGRRAVSSTNIEGDLMALRPYLSIAHHVPGRIRLRFAGAVVTQLGADRLTAFAERAKASAAVRSFRVNAVGRSLTIEYDPAVLPPTLWTCFLSDDHQGATGIAAQLAPHLAG